MKKIFDVGVNGEVSDANGCFIGSCLNTDIQPDLEQDKLSIKQIQALK